MSGLMTITGDKESAPLRVGYPVADTIGGTTAAFAIAAALVKAQRTGQGETIDVSMLEATLVTMGWAVSNWLIAGVAPEPLGNENMSSSPSGAFETKEGLLNIAANKQEQFQALCRLIGRPELASDPRFADREDRKRRRYELKAEIERGLAARPAREWCPMLNEADVPAGEILTVPEILEHPQIVGRRVVRTFPGVPGVDRTVSVVRSGFRLASGDPEPASPPPALGADTASILAELGLDSEEVAALGERGVI